MSNRLNNQKSPYLLQHKENPVDWYPWGREAFDRAAGEDKPIFLSIGYSTCHWCHVMAHESFEDEEVAGILNQEYISIKVDREERPDIDAVYMSACQAVTGSGGWPLTILMTPDQKPFFAGTYFPKSSQYGQPGLIELLVSVAKLWKNDRKELIGNTERIMAAIRPNRESSERAPEKKIFEEAYRLFCRQFDPKWGGFGSAPRFPVPHNLLFLMRYASAEAVPKALDMAEAVLDAMARGGIFDAIGGGFSRYSTDERWLVPHFEKMLYDNALLVLTYLKGYQLTGKEEYADTARRTADYILQELMDKEGGFYCGQDADSDGVEGKYYVFDPEEIKSVLGEADGEEFCRLYHITAAGNFEGRSIPNRIGQTEAGWRADDARLKKLYEYRLKRTSLHRDDKILLSWNGWAIMALAYAGQVFGEERYLNAAVRAQRFVASHMEDIDGRLYLRYRDEEAACSGQLEDYAVYSLALLELYRSTFRTEYLGEALRRAEQMLDLFEDTENGGYYMTAIDAEKLIARPKETYDGALPSGNSVAGMLLQRLALLTGEIKWQAATDRQLRFLAGEIKGYPAGHSFALLALMEALYPHRELVCSTVGGVPKELVRYLKEYPADGLFVLVRTPENAQELSSCAPFTAAYPLPEEGAVYYLCENGICMSPERDWEKVAAVINKPQTYQQ